LIVKHEDSYDKVSILSIQVDGNDVEMIKSGEVGILIDKPIKRNSKICLANTIQ